MRERPRGRGYEGAHLHGARHRSVFRQGPVHRWPRGLPGEVAAHPLAVPHGQLQGRVALRLEAQREQAGLLGGKGKGERRGRRTRMSHHHQTRHTLRPKLAPQRGQWMAGCRHFDIPRTNARCPLFSLPFPCPTSSVLPLGYAPAARRRSGDPPP